MTLTTRIKILTDSHLDCNGYNELHSWFEVMIARSRWVYIGIGEAQYPGNDGEWWKGLRKPYYFPQRSTWFLLFFPCRLTEQSIWSAMDDSISFFDALFSTFVFSFRFLIRLLSTPPYIERKNSFQERGKNKVIKKEVECEKISFPL